MGVIAGFLCGVAAVALAIRSDLGFQLASGPSLFLAGYVAADRRRVLLSERFTFAFGVAAGGLTMILRWYGQGQQAAWQSLLLVSAVVTLILRVQAMLRQRARTQSRPAPVRTLTVESGVSDPHRLWAPVRPPVRQPVVAASPMATAYSRGPISRPVRSFETQSDSNDLVRQMRNAATRSGPLGGASVNPFLLVPALLILNPLGLWLTWRSASLSRTTKLLLSAVSLLWYLAAAGLAFALTHR